jgi:hypothetical protein
VFLGVCTIGTPPDVHQSVQAALARSNSRILEEQQQQQQQQQQPLISQDIEALDAVSETLLIISPNKNTPKKKLNRLRKQSERMAGSVSKLRCGRDK